jgi:hypothetical protein
VAEHVQDFQLAAAERVGEGGGGGGVVGGGVVGGGGREAAAGGGAGPIGALAFEAFDVRAFALKPNDKA